MWFLFIKYSPKCCTQQKKYLHGQNNNTSWHGRRIWFFYNVTFNEPTNLFFERKFTFSGSYFNFKAFLMSLNFKVFLTAFKKWICSPCYHRKYFTHMCISLNWMITSSLVVVVDVKCVFLSMTYWFKNSQNKQLKCSLLRRVIVQ